MKTLVAGGAGFIGSHLVDALLSEGHTVACIDNFFIGTKQNISHIQNNERFHFYELDLCDSSALGPVFEKEQPEIIFHLAANSDIQASAKKPAIEYHNTYSTTFSILECMRVYQVKRLFFSSTSAVYGEKEGMNVSEEIEPLNPISYYGAAKLGAEGLIQAYSYMNDISSLIFRFPNVIGPRLTHGVIFDFIKKLEDNPDELMILGDGEQTKPYLHVSDLVQCIMRFAFDGDGVRIYNIGDATQSRVTDIARMVSEAMGLNPTLRYTGGRGGWKGDVPRFAFHLDKIHAAGWRASMTSDEAVRRAAKEAIACRQ